MLLCFRFLQGGVGGVTVIFLASILFLGGNSGWIAVLHMILIGAAVYGVLWFLHKIVVPDDGSQSAQHTGEARTDYTWVAWVVGTAIVFIFLTQLLQEGHKWT